MVKVKLKVPRFKQTDPMGCGHASLQEVFVYYGKNVPQSKILRDIGVRGYGSWITQLGLYAMKNGFKAKIITEDANYLDPTWKKLSKKNLIKKLRVALKKANGRMKKDAYRYLIKFLKNGGYLEFRQATKSDVVRYLKKKIPVIMCLSSTVLHKGRRYGKKGKRSEYGYPAGHFVVVSGYNNGRFTIADSHKKVGGILTFNEDLLIYSWYFWGGWMLVISNETKK